MFNNNKDIDLLVSYNYKEPFYIKNLRTIKLIIPAILLLILFLGIFVFLQLDNGNRQKEINESKNTLKLLQEEAAKTAELDSIYEKHLEVKRTNENIEVINKALDSYPKLTKTAMNTIGIACIRTTIKSVIYNEETGTVAVYVEAPDVALGEEIVRKLKLSEDFTYVTHKGYKANELLTTTDGKNQTDIKYNVEITCELTGGI